MVRSSTGGPGPVSLNAKSMHASILSGARPDGTPVPSFRSCLQRHPLNGPTVALTIAPFTNALTRNPEPFLARFCRSESPRISGKQARHPCLIRRSEWSIWNPVREFGGTKNHPAPNDPKLGRLRCARQGLVRVPESNTKYGANWGKPEGGGRPICAKYQ